jgi:hypothetical protein
MVFVLLLKAKAMINFCKISVLLLMILGQIGLRNEEKKPSKN